jgi:hypothetical protein
MKRYRDLYDQVTSFENLWLAYRRAARGNATATRRRRGCRPWCRSEADVDLHLD